jgi:hypothetical protein
MRDQLSRNANQQCAFSTSKHQQRIFSLASEFVSTPNKMLIQCLQIEYDITTNETVKVLSSNVRGYGLYQTSGKFKLTIRRITTAL